jgi:hypothetical protein
VAIGKYLLRLALFIPLAVGIGNRALAASDYWIFDGSTYARVIWQQDGTVSEEKGLYASPDMKSQVFAGAGLASAESESAEATANVGGSAWAKVLATGMLGSHTVLVNANAANTLYVAAPGDYAVSFDYIVGPQANGLTSLDASIGYETSVLDFRINTQTAGHYASTVHVNDWISFYARSGGNSPIGVVETSAFLFGLTVTPVPEPEPAWMFGAGGALLALLAGRRKLRRGRMAGI